MRQLHLVGFTSDQDGIILAGRRGSKTGGYVVTMDEEFLEQLDHARRARVGHDAGLSQLEPKSRVESALSPREMQTRLRGGRTVAQVAAEAGVPLEWVERWAVPVLAEQAAAIERAMSTTMRTQRRGYSDRPLGSSVLRNLADRGVRLAEDEFDELWTAFQLAENEWVIRFRHRWRGRDLDAEWLLDEGAGSLTPSNRQATELGFVDPGRHAPPVKGLAPVRVLRRSGPSAVPGAVGAVAVEIPQAPAARASKSRPKAAKAGRAAKAARAAKASRAGKAPAAAKKTATKKAAVKKTATRKPAARKPAAKKSAAKKSAAKKSAAKKSATRKTAAKKPAAKKTAGKKTAARQTTAARKAPSRAGKSSAARRPLKAKKRAKAAPAKAATAARPAGRRQRPLKAVRVASNGKAHATVRAGRAGSTSRNGSAARRAAPVSRAGGNGSRRSRG